MGVDWPIDTTLDELIDVLTKLKKEHGGDTKVTLPNPGFYDQYIDGDGRLTAKFGRNYLNQDCVMIVEETGR